jgi:hypothetical protein
MAFHAPAKVLEAYGQGELDAAVAETLSYRLKQCSECLHTVTAMSGGRFRKQVLEAQYATVVPGAEQRDHAVIAKLLQKDRARRIQEEKRMPYITSIQRVDYRRGLRKGIEVVLRARWGDEGLKLMPKIDAIHDEEQLERILNAIECAPNPDAVRPLLVPQTP